MGASEMTINFVANAPGPLFQRFTQGAHESLAWEYDCNEMEMWAASDRFHVGRASRDTAGGLDYDYNWLNIKGQTYLGRVWFTGTALNPCFAFTDVVSITGQKAAYGIAGFDPRPGFGGHSYYGPHTFSTGPPYLAINNLAGDTLIVDYNGQGDQSWYSKNRFGDVEIPINR